MIKGFAEISGRGNVVFKMRAKRYDEGVDFDFGSAQRKDTEPFRELRITLIWQKSHNASTAHPSSATISLSSPLIRQQPSESDSSLKKSTRRRPATREPIGD